MNRTEWFLLQLQAVLDTIPDAVIKLDISCVDGVLAVRDGVDGSDAGIKVSYVGDRPNLERSTRGNEMTRLRDYLEYLLPALVFADASIINLTVNGSTVTLVRSAKADIELDAKGLSAAEIMEQLGKELSEGQ